MKKKLAKLWQGFLIISIPINAKISVTILIALLLLSIFLILNLYKIWLLA